VKSNVFVMLNACVRHQDRRAIRTPLAQRQTGEKYH
jgi:hypothetical protein